MTEPHEADHPKIDVRKAIEFSSRKTSLRALQQQGYKNVRVLDHKKIDELISEAVHATFERMSHTLADLGTEDIHKGAKEEFLKLLYEHQKPPQTVEEEHRAKIRSLQGRVTELSSLLAQRESELEEARQAPVSTMDDLARADHEQETAGLRRKLEEKDARIQVLTEERDRLRSGPDAGALAAELAEARTRIEEARAEVAGLREKLAAYETSVDPRDLEQKIRDLEVSLARKDKRIAEQEEATQQAVLDTTRLAARVLPLLADAEKRRRLKALDPDTTPGLDDTEPRMAVTLAGPLDTLLNAAVAELAPLRGQVRHLEDQIAVLQREVHRLQTHAGTAGQKAPAPGGQASGNPASGEYLPDLAEANFHRKGNYLSRSRRARDKAG